MMKWLKTICLLTGFTVLAVSSADARQVEDLYSTEVIVSAQSDAQLRKAASEGLATVFVRISGDAAVLNNPSVRSARSKAQTYLNKFSYHSEPQEDGEALLSVQLEFEAALVSKTLRQAGLPIWSDDRPAVLVWLVTDDKQGRQVVNEASNPELVASIRHHSKRRGLALIGPEGQASISPSPFWQFNRSAIAQASEAYQPDAILVGKLSRLSSGRWLGQWQYQQGGKKVNFEGDAADADSFIAAGLDQVANIQARAYAIVPVKVSNEGFVMALSGVKGFRDYARAIAHLESLTAVKHANIIHLQADQLILRLTVEGQQSQLEKAIALGRQLQPQAVSVDSVYPVVMSYRWSGK